MTLDAADLQLLHDIANLRAWLAAPVLPEGTPLHRRAEAISGQRARLALLELEWLEHGLAAAGLPHAP